MIVFLCHNVECKQASQVYTDHTSMQAHMNTQTDKEASSLSRCGGEANSDGHVGLNSFFGGGGGGCSGG